MEKEYSTYSGSMLCETQPRDGKLWPLTFIFLQDFTTTVTVQKARDPIASENRIFIRNTPKYSGCEEINGRAGADLSAVQVQISSAVQVQ